MRTSKVIFLIFYLCLGTKTNELHNCSINWFENIMATAFDQYDIDGGRTDMLSMMTNEKVIKISHQEVFILCEDAFNLPHVEELYFVNMSLVDLAPGAFKNLTAIKKLVIVSNNFKDVRFGVFNNLQLQYLDLSRNHIHKIHRRSFDDMPKLTHLNLHHNKLKKINKFWFTNCPSLANINFQHNVIEMVPKKAFMRIGRNNFVSIDLSSNKIKRIAESFANFSSMSDDKPTYRQVFWVDLRRNLLTCVPYSFLDCVKSVNLLDNSLSMLCLKRLFLYENYIVKSIDLIYY